MKRYAQPVTAAEGDSPLDVTLEELEENFNYVLEGFSMLDRQGAEGAKTALAIALELQSAVTVAIGSIANVTSGGNEVQ